MEVERARYRKVLSFFSHLINDSLTGIRNNNWVLLQVLVGFGMIVSPRRSPEKVALLMGLNASLIVKKIETWYSTGKVEKKQYG